MVTCEYSANPRLLLKISQEDPQKFKDFCEKYMSELQILIPKISSTVNTIIAYQNRKIEGGCRGPEY